MKGRSHRLPPSAPLEDWGDGQWTVDCSCGVTFDDGEEMVSCDECGVWVHTRCSRYVRGEASFACHNCKASAKRPRSTAASVADTEETEVAQLLVELPTKTDRCPPPIPYRPPFRLWAHVPMEEKVHVQGVPGGDPSLFRGLSSSILSPELWKCSGYVPKKFNFKYKEFPCWEEEERDKASRGADVLFSLSKETVQAAPVRAFDNLLSSPDGSKKKVGEKALFGSRPFGCVKKERNKLRVMGSHSSKGRKEGSGEEKDIIGRKNAGGDLARAFSRIKERALSAPLCDSRKEDLREDGGLQTAESAVPHAKSLYNRDEVLPKASTKNLEEGMENGSKPKHTLVFKTSKRGLSDEALRSKLSLETPVKVEKVDRMDARISCTLNTVAAFSAEGSNTSKDVIGHEDVGKSIHGFREPKDESCVDSLLNGGSSGAAIELEKMKADINTQDSQIDMPDITLIPSSASNFLSTKKVEINVKTDANDAQALENSGIPSHLSAGMDDLPKYQLKTKDNSSIILEEAKSDRNLQSEVVKPLVLQKDSELRQSYQECTNAAGVEPLLHEQIVETADSLTRWKSSFETNHVPKFYSTSPSKSNDANPNNSIPIQKVVSIEKELSTSTVPAVSKSSVSSNQNSTANAISSSLTGKSLVKQQRVKLTNSNAGNGIATMTFISSEEGEQEAQPQPAKGHPSGSKSLQAGRISHSSVPKNCSLDFEEQVFSPSSQISVENPSTLLRTAEATASLSQTPTNQLKPVPSGSYQRNDKAIQLSTQPASKLLSHSLVTQASVSTNVATALSDEELALLLHQELNSSPRVPRVPRMRQATSTQLTTPSASSMLSKRSYSGGRDQVSVFRRKHKVDASKDSVRNSQDAIDESRRMGRHSPEPKRHESAVLSDGFVTKGKRRSPDVMASSKANVPGTSTGGVNSLTTSFEENWSRTFVRSSLANVDGDGTLVARSLPGLIDEIMSKGKCSTYEELCDDVRPVWCTRMSRSFKFFFFFFLVPMLLVYLSLFVPLQYWHSLRKPNGERYAYSSHSQAVLDCLRNRSEWAHLIDRGPKTNASKRRRKLDSEAAAMELDHEDVKSRGSREGVDKSSGNSHREEFPKGKRNVRKRRLLERRGGGTKESAYTHNCQGIFSDDDAAAISHSSNEDAECHVNLSDDAGADSSTTNSCDSD